MQVSVNVAEGPKLIRPSGTEQLHRQSFPPMHAWALKRDAVASPERGDTI